ncbi:MAG: Gfo/Idh/MocA family oxidoreductase [Verrucomicrobiota bacterium]
MLRPLLSLLFAVVFSSSAHAAEKSPSPAPLRVLLAGVVHGHANGFLRQADAATRTIVGVWERDEAAWAKYQKNPKLAGITRYTDLAEAMAKSGAEAVWAFSTTQDHLPIVRAAAPRKLPVIVEKPLAVSYADAAEMAALAKQHGTLVLTNYETSWYPTFEEVRQLLGNSGPLGPLRQIYAHAGHEGPVAIKSPPEFLSWLRDPVRAGGGALFDFGCYGANLATWWLGNRAPLSVTAQTSRFDPVNYPDCDDHSVIQLTYPDLQVTVVGSWHWPFNRKDVTLYGERGTIATINDRDYTFREGRKPTESRQAKPERRVPLRWFAETIRTGQDPVDDPSSLANNLITMKILDAARRSAKEGRTIPLSEYK